MVYIRSLSVAMKLQGKMKFLAKHDELRDKVVCIIKDHRDQCKEVNPDVGGSCPHGKMLREVFSDLDGEVKKGLLGPTSERSPFPCYGTPLTLNKVLRQSPFTVDIGRKGYRCLFMNWEIQPRKQARPLTLLHEALSFLVKFMTARPEIVRGYPCSKIERGGYLVVFKDRVPVEGKTIKDAPKVLQAQGWVRISLNSNWVRWVRGVKHWDKDDAFDEEWTTLYHGSSIECLSSQLRHGLQSFSWAGGGRGETSENSFVYFVKRENADRHLMSYSDALYDRRAGWIYQIVWEVKVKKSAVKGSSRYHQEMHRRHGFTEKALWLRVLNFQEEVLDEQKVSKLRAGFVSTLEVLVMPW